MQICFFDIIFREISSFDHLSLQKVAILAPYLETCGVFSVAFATFCKIKGQNFIFLIGTKTFQTDCGGEITSN